MKDNKVNAGLIVGAIIGLLTACAAIAFFFYHGEQDRKRLEKWRHYDDKYLDD